MLSIESLVDAVPDDVDHRVTQFVSLQAVLVQEDRLRRYQRRTYKIKGAGLAARILAGIHCRHCDIHADLSQLISYYLAREQKFPGAKVLGSFAPGSESSRERKFLGAKVHFHTMVLSLLGVKVLRSESSCYQKRLSDRPF